MNVFAKIKQTGLTTMSEAKTMKDPYNNPNSDTMY